MTLPGAAASGILDAAHDCCRPPVQHGRAAQRLYGIRKPTSAFMSTLRLALSAAVCAAIGLAAPAQAQPQRQAAPQFGTLAAGDAPSTLAIEAGGPDRNAIPGSGCSGFLRNAAPAAVVTHTGGPLSIYVTSDTDTTLLVADPSGRWQCSDDADDINPGVTFSAGQAGTYTVWVGTFSPEAAGATARLSAIRGRPRW